MRLLNGAELADYIKTRQAAQVRRLSQQYNVQPKLAIIVTVDNKVIDTYVHLKEQYAEDLLIDVQVYKIKQDQLSETISQLNNDPSTHGIIIQLPLEDPSQTDEMTALVAPHKDVDGLGAKPDFTPATPKAIMWLLSGYNIELRDKNILIIGLGKLVGEPLKRVLIESELDPKTADINTANLKAATLEADIIITATGDPGIIKSDMIKAKAVVVDAGTASEKGGIAGDVDKQVYEDRTDLTITPRRGGVGPLTVCALFDNVIIAAENTITES